MELCLNTNPFLQTGCSYGAFKNASYTVYYLLFQPTTTPKPLVETVWFKQIGALAFHISMI